MSNYSRREVLYGLAIMVASSRAFAVTGEEVEFGKIKLSVQDGEKTKLRKGRIIFYQDELCILPAKGDAVSISYREIQAATYSFSKHPRWKAGIGLAVAVGVFALPVFFMKSKKHWLTIQCSTHSTVVQLSKKNFQQVVAELESRAVLDVERILES